MLTKLGEQVCYLAIKWLTAGCDFDFVGVFDIGEGLTVGVDELEEIVVAAPTVGGIVLLERLAVAEYVGEAA